MADDCIDGDYLGAYSRFFTEFAARVKPHDQLPVSVSSYNVTKAEMVGEIINVTLQYLNKTQCPPSLQAHLVHQVVQEIDAMCKKQPKDYGFKSEEKTYTSLKLMQAVIAKVNEICTRYLDNSRLALLPPPPCSPLPQVAAGGNKNCRRSMEDRYVVLHDLHTTFGIQDDSIVNYYAVFDGHAGQDAAVYCATHLHQYLAENIYYSTNPESALYQAFIITDAQFAEKHKTQKICGGTTAVCTLLTNKKLYVAWVGDSPAILIKRDSIVQLVNPHRLHRDDERQRIEDMGGLVIQTMGTLRVNGELSVSRAIGDVLYKPFVTGDPEVNSVILDGTEDFLVLATDGLTDYLEPAEILTILYHEIRRNPSNGLKRAHHILVQWAKYAGSKDNITVIVVLLTPSSEIAARPRYVHPYYLSEVNDILEEMNSKDKPVQRDIDYAHNAIFLKQTMLSQDPCDPEDNILEASNGKHENGDADYDYSDLGPETNVDTIDDVATLPVRNLSHEFFKDNDDKDDLDVDETRNSHENDEIAAPKLVQDEGPEEIHEETSNKVRESFEVNAEEEVLIKKEDNVEESQDAVDEAGPMDYDESPPSPQANKPLQQALIHEADNVADSEDSEDEWNYYRVDPNKEKAPSAPVDEAQESTNEKEAEIPEFVVENTESQIQPEDIEEDIKCESPKEEPPELINTEISAEDKAKESEEEQEDKSSVEEQEKSRTMDFPLNPDAAEFIPVSPQFTGAAPTMNLQDFPVSGSPFKQVSQMDDIQVPSQSEFEKEVCQRPSEVENEEDEKEYQNGNHQQLNTDLVDYMNDRQKTASFINTLDDSEISSTKAEYGDTSVSFLTTTEFHRTGISAVDESFSSSERDYDIAKDPMAMSFTPSDFEAAFDKGVDLNAVHNLSNSDLDEKNGSMEKEEEDELRSQSPEPQLQSTANNLESPEDERPPQELVVVEEYTELVNLSSQPEESEATFIEHADKPQPVGAFLDLQTESSLMEQQEAKEDHSPLTENYSAEFESVKEPMSVDNQQPLSPSSADVDETKLVDEASEDAVLPVTDLQKEASVKETDTPSSLSPIPDVIDNEVLASVDSTEVPYVPVQCSLHADAPEFTPKESYNFQYDMETRVSRSPIEDVCQIASMQAEDVCQKTPLQDEDVCQKTPMETVDVCQETPMQDEDVCQKTPMQVEDVCQEAPMQAEDVCQIEPMQVEDVCQKAPMVAEDVCQIASMQVEDVCRKMPMQDEDVCQKTPMETVDVCQETPVQAEDICQTAPMQAEDIRQETPIQAEDVYQAPPSTEISCTYQPYSTQADDVYEVSQNLQQLNEDVQPVEEGQVVEMIVTKPAEENLLDFSEEQQEICTKSQELHELTPPLSPREVEEKVTQSIDDLVCPVQPKEQKLDEVEQKEEGPVEADVLETRPEEEIEPAKETTLNLSESMQEFTGLESQLQPKIEEVPEPCVVPEVQNEISQKEELKDQLKEELKEEVLKEQLKEEPKEEIEPEKAMEPVLVEEEYTVQEEIKEVSSSIKEPEVEKAEEAMEAVETVVQAIEATETTEAVKVEEASEDKTTESSTAAVAAAAAASAVVVAAATTTQSKAKAKTTTTKSTKTTTSKATTPKSTPTSPSKAAISSPRTTAATAKKPTTTAATRPKDLDTPKKPTVSSTAPKTSTPKPAAKSTISSTSAPKPSTRTSTATAAKPKPATTASKTSVKATANGDVKPISKPAAPKSAAAKAAPAAATKSTLVKASTTRTSTGATTSKPKPATATTTTKTNTTAKSTTTTTTTSSTARPKTAPSVGSTTKTTRTTPSKSPMIDKQVKETANKQISMARTSSVTKTRLSASATTTTTVKRVSSGTKTTSASPVKKTTTTSKVSGKTSTGAKAPTDKGKVLQNGVSEKVEISTIIDDVPKKDLSPVIAPNDNQLIMSSD